MQLPPGLNVPSPPPTLLPPSPPPPPRRRNQPVLLLALGALLGGIVALAAVALVVGVNRTVPPGSTAQASPTAAGIVMVTVAPPTAVPPTAVPPSAVPPTAVPPTAVPPSAVPPTAVPPTAVPPTAVPPTAPLPTIPPLAALDPGRPALSTATITRDATTAVDALRRFYELVNSRQYDASYDLMSARLRAGTPLTTYRTWYANKRGIVMSRLARSEMLAADRIVLYAEVTSTDVIDGQVVTRNYLDAWTLVREGNAWHLDAVQTSRL